MNNKKIFIDGISEIDYISQVIRMKTYTLKTKHIADQNKTEYEIIPEQEIITSLDGFCSSFNTMKTVMEKLVAEGMVKESIFDRTQIKDVTEDK